MSVFEEFHATCWRRMPRNIMAHLEKPRYGCGTVIVAFWTFCDLVPTLVDATRAAGGELRMEDGGIVRFGRPAWKFLHKIYRAPR